MAFRLPEPLRRRPWAAILGLAFAWLAFLAGPEWAIERNQALGWPRWRHPAGQVAAVLVILGAGVVILRCSSLFARAALLLYAVGCIGITQLVLILWEEPVLHRRFGTAWDGYVRRVPRWLGRPAPPS